jgi:DNA-binding beta-propeller fold protein YncE
MPSRFSRTTLGALLALPLFLTACDSATDPAGCTGGDCLPPQATVFVGNQGNFTAGDGSVTVYDPERDEATEPISDLASIVQSVTAAFGRLYVTANTGGRVEVYDAASYDRVGRVEVANPRYVAIDGEGRRLFVTSQLYDRPSEVAVVDAETFEVVETVAVGGFAEGIAVSEGRVFVATGAFGATQEVVVLDAATNEVVQRIDVGCTAPRSLATDADGEVWVFCAGAPATGAAPEVESEVVVLNAATGEVMTRIAVDGRIDTTGPGQDVHAPLAPTILAVRDQDTLLRFDVVSNTLEATIPLDGDPIGAVAFDPLYERIYVGRVPGFDVAGSVTIHEADGTQVGQFTAGAAPAAIALTPYAVVN